MSTGIYIRSPEHRRKIAAALLGHPVSEETRRRLSVANLGKRRFGRPVSEETRRRISAGNARHGHSCGGRESPTYKSWSGLLRRCRNSNSKDYDLYGGRGITVCARWLSFENFLADMGEKPPGRSIDRIDNDGNYEPGNCRWATPKQQANNRRRARA